MDSVELSDLIEGVDGRGETSVEAEDLSFDHSGQGQVVEELSELLPHVGVAVLSQALVVETITKFNQSDHMFKQVALLYLLKKE